jgi:hypothetical protein
MISIRLSTADRLHPERRTAAVQNQIGLLHLQTEDQNRIFRRDSDALLAVDRKRNLVFSASPWEAWGRVRPERSRLGTTRSAPQTACSRAPDRLGDQITGALESGGKPSPKVTIL